MPVWERVFPAEYIFRRFCRLPPAVPVCRSLPEGPASRITGRSAAVCRIFARFQLAGGDFQCDLLHGIAELLYHEDSALFRQGYYADTAGVVYHITLYLLAVLQFRCVPRHVENFALIGLFATGCFFL